MERKYGIGVLAAGTDKEEVKNLTCGCRATVYYKGNTMVHGYFNHVCYMHRKVWEVGR